MWIAIHQGVYLYSPRNTSLTEHSIYGQVTPLWVGTPVRSVECALTLSLIFSPFINNISLIRTSHGTYHQLSLSLGSLWDPCCWLKLSIRTYTLTIYLWRSGTLVRIADAIGAVHNVYIFYEQRTCYSHLNSYAHQLEWEYALNLSISVSAA